MGSLERKRGCLCFSYNAKKAFVQFPVNQACQEEGNGFQGCKGSASVRDEEKDKTGGPSFSSHGVKYILFLQDEVLNQCRTEIGQWQTQFAKLNLEIAEKSELLRDAREHAAGAAATAAAAEQRSSELLQRVSDLEAAALQRVTQVGVPPLLCAALPMPHVCLLCPSNVHVPDFEAMGLPNTSPAGLELVSLDLKHMRLCLAAQDSFPLA